jgi:hypothetical protein
LTSKLPSINRIASNLLPDLCNVPTSYLEFFQFIQEICRFVSFPIIFPIFSRFFQIFSRFFQIILVSSKLFHIFPRLHPFFSSHFSSPPSSTRRPQDGAGGPHPAAGTAPDTGDGCLADEPIGGEDGRMRSLGTWGICFIQYLSISLGISSTDGMMIWMFPKSWRSQRVVCNGTFHENGWFGGTPMT